MPLPEPYRRDVEQISANAQHLGGLIGDVLDLASSDAGQLRLTNEFVDLSEALRLVAETGRQLAYDKGLGWHADLPESGPWVWGDRTRLRQVVLNLVNNAVKFTAQGAGAPGTGIRPRLCHRGGVRHRPGDSTRGASPRFSTSSAARNGAWRAAMAAWAWDWRSADGSSKCTAGRSVCGPQARRAPARPSISRCRPCNHRQLRLNALPSRPSPKRAYLVLTNRAGSGQRLQEYLDERGFEVQDGIHG